MHTKSAIHRHKSTLSRLLTSTRTLIKLFPVVVFAVTLVESSYAATPGLPFTEDFSSQTLMDTGQTSANWSTDEQAVLLAFHSQRLHRLPDGSTAAAGNNLGSETDFTTALSLGDVDGDGDLDLVANTMSVIPTACYLNGTAMAWVRASPLRQHRRSAVTTDFTFAVSLGDVDGDGDLDLLWRQLSAKPTACTSTMAVADPSE